ncbi:MAG: hypothetical protein HY290_30755 [Planctomycetia bacterium]|nr:hypothetical protein [Planctomycetia bacterium]
MSESMDFAVPLTRQSVSAPPGLLRSNETRDERLLAIATESTHRFQFAPLCWPAAVDSLVKFLMTFVPGVFLLTQVSATPSLKVQIAVVGALLIAGGMVFFAQSVHDLLGGLTIDAAGITSRRGLLLSKTISWSDLRCWNVNESAAKTTDIPSIQFWTADTKFPQVTIFGGCLTEKDHRLVRQLLQVFDPSKETA